MVFAFFPFTAESNLVLLKFDAAAVSPPIFVPLSYEAFSMPPALRAEDAVASWSTSLVICSADEPTFFPFYNL